MILRWRTDSHTPGSEILFAVKCWEILFTVLGTWYHRASSHPKPEVQVQVPVIPSSEYDATWFGMKILSLVTLEAFPYPFKEAFGPAGSRLLVRLWRVGRNGKCELEMSWNETRVILKEKSGKRRWRGSWNLGRVFEIRHREVIHTFTVDKEIRDHGFFHYLY